MDCLLLNKRDELVSHVSRSSNQVAVVTWYGVTCDYIEEFRNIIGQHLIRSQ